MGRLILFSFLVLGAACHWHHRLRPGECRTYCGYSYCETVCNYSHHDIYYLRAPDDPASARADETVEFYRVEAEAFAGEPYTRIEAVHRLEQLYRDLADLDAVADPTSASWQTVRDAIQAGIETNQAWYREQVGMDYVPKTVAVAPTQDARVN